MLQAVAVLRLYAGMCEKVFALLFRSMESTEGRTWLVRNVTILYMFTFIDCFDAHGRSMCSDLKWHGDESPDPPSEVRIVWTPAAADSPCITVGVIVSTRGTPKDWNYFRSAGAAISFVFSLPGKFPET